MPASTWAMGIPASAPAIAPARVEFVSPYTSTTSGRVSSITGSRASSIRPACDVFEPPDTLSSRSGAGSPSSLKNTAESSSSKCWPVWTITSSCCSRSFGDTAAALMNWGRLPITVSTFIVRHPSGRPPPQRRAISPASSAAELGADAVRDGRRRSRRDGTDAVELAVIDGRHRMYLARRGGQEGLVGAGEILQRAGPLPDIRDVDHEGAGDRGQDVVLERRGERLAVLHPEDRARRRLEHAAVRRDQDGLVIAAFTRHSRRQQ